MSMKDGKRPDPDTVHPIAGYDKEIYALFAAISAKENCLRINARSATQIRAILWAEYETNNESVSEGDCVTSLANRKSMPQDCIITLCSQKTQALLSDLLIKGLVFETNTLSIYRAIIHLLSKVHADCSIRMPRRPHHPP